MDTETLEKIDYWLDLGELWRKPYHGMSLQSIPYQVIGQLSHEVRRLRKELARMNGAYEAVCNDRDSADKRAIKAESDLKAAREMTK